MSTEVATTKKYEWIASISFNILERWNCEEIFDQNTTSIKNDFAILLKVLDNQKEINEISLNQISPNKWITNVRYSYELLSVNYEVYIDSWRNVSVQWKKPSFKL
ncbi:hypothetical protein WUBG_10865 [Wuchereria bancrofti]|uniref:Uncharacterized protein n=1 Tax=Wuchereria bancrofti TaxID=6293 RepID=J9E7V8_WUCBA|nr:hypothetical protein WUBG_10865 [Wuchereria bancrofti]